MSASTLLPCIEGIALDSIVSTHNSIVLQLSTFAPSVACPVCGRPSGRVHSRYQRTLADLPWNQIAVRMHLRSRKLFCDNPACERVVFTEPLPKLAARYARKTLQLQEALYIIGYVIGGKAGARVAVGLGLSVSPDTLLRRVRYVAQEHTPATNGLRIVGVDDWAFRKGHRYGTILVDLERRCLAGLLPDRSSESLAAWLKQHPSIEVVSRDRAGVYADGARQGAPQAQQVADRWHLLRNLGEMVERLTSQHVPLLRQAAEQVKATTTSLPLSPPPPEPVPVSPSEQQRLTHRQQRLTCYQNIQQLHQQGVGIAAIVAAVGVSRRTVFRLLRAEQFPERAPRRRQARNTDAYAGYLRQRLSEGCANATQLYREVQEQGYTGSYLNVYKALVSLSGASSDKKRWASGKPRSPSEVSGEVPSSRRVAWWMQGYLNTSKPEVAQEQRTFLQQLYGLAPNLQEAADLAQEFAHILKKRQGTELQSWLERASQSVCKEVRLFAKSLRQDLAAVRNAVTMEWSNGQTEGQVNRLKMLKRQMYGRANFDLLQARVMPMAKAA